MKALEVDLELVKKYNVPGPRYTSYPPATEFSQDAHQPRLEREFHRRNDRSNDISLYFHLPFCYSLCWYCGCNTVITTRQQDSETYLDYLKRELAVKKPWMDPARQVVQMHLGGGTPTFLSPEEIRRLGGWLHSEFNIASDVEAGVEIDPRRLTQDHITALREVGFNRASIGVQDNNSAVQKAIHRIQPKELTDQVIQWAREAGFGSLNIDLMYGLPRQTPASFEKTLDDVLEWRPDRIAVFSYAHVPWIKPAQRILEKSSLPSAEEKLDLLKMTIEKLTARNYVYIGMDHFAREDDELAIAQRNKTLQRNFQGYSTHGQADIHAFGMSAISQVGRAYWQNLKELKPYYAALDEGALPFFKGRELSEDDALRRQAIMRLMCDLELDYQAMSQLLGVDFGDYFEDELAGLDDLELDGLVERTPAGLTVTPAGRLFIRNIAMRFDRYLSPVGEKRFSKTV